MKIHEIIAENRVRFASRLNEMSEELANLAREVDKNRKAVCHIAALQFHFLEFDPKHDPDQGTRIPVRT